MRMHKLKALLSLSKPFRRNDSSFFLSNHYCRQFSAQPSYTQVDYLQEQVSFHSLFFLIKQLLMHIQRLFREIPITCCFYRCWLKEGPSQEQLF